MGRKHQNRKKRLRKERARKQSRTKIEEQIARLLDTMGVDYKQNNQIGQYNVDFLIDGKYVVECYGDYWHCNPQRYDGEYYNRGLKYKANQRWMKDERRLNELVMSGYPVLVLWENEINSCLKCCTQKIRKLINGDLTVT